MTAPVSTTPSASVQLTGSGAEAARYGRAPRRSAARTALRMFASA